MVELPCTPARRIMAVIALLAETASVWVFVDVTGHASTADIMKRGGRVALIACQVRVHTEQWKTRNIVIEP